MSDHTLSGKNGVQGIRYDHKTNVFYPSTTEEVQRLILFAKAKNALIRAMGAHHSPAEAVFASVGNQLCIQLTGDLRKIYSIQVDENENHAYVSVGAGCYLGVNPKDKNSQLENSFNYQVHQMGYALPTLGGISHQSIAGFLQTSSSGGSAKHAIADSIEEIELINGKGELCCFKKGESEFNAIGVGMGLFGIITRVVFKVCKKFLVEGIEENKKNHDSFLRKNAVGHYHALEKALFEDHEYAHINWFPQKYVNRVMEWTGRAVSADLPIQVYKHPLKSKIISHIAAAILKTNNLLDNMKRHTLFAQRTKSILLKPFVTLNNRKTFRDLWYKALPIDDQADVNGLINTLFSEIWFPKDQLSRVMQTLEELIAVDPKAAGNFIIEFYAAKKSPFWLSPGYNQDSFRVDLYWWARNAGCSTTYFKRFWNVLLDIPGTRFHWGKNLPTPGQQYGKTIFNLDYLNSVYPKLKDWLAFREKMDPHQLFITDYWREIFAIPHALENKINANQYTPILSRNVINTLK